MPARHRINGTGDFTCENRGFKTNAKKGYAHGSYSPNKGSVFPDPLTTSNGYTLWLEHVISKHNGSESYWLMWYDAHGWPTIPASGVMDRDGVGKMAGALARFMP